MGTFETKCSQIVYPNMFRANQGRELIARDLGHESTREALSWASPDHENQLMKTHGGAQWAFEGIFFVIRTLMSSSNLCHCDVLLLFAAYQK